MADVNLSLGLGFFLAACCDRRVPLGRAPGTRCLALLGPCTSQGDQALGAHPFLKLLAFLFGFFLDKADAYLPEVVKYVLDRGDPCLPESVVALWEHRVCGVQGLSS